MSIPLNLPKKNKDGIWYCPTCLRYMRSGEAVHEDRQCIAHLQHQQVLMIGVLSEVFEPYERFWATDSDLNEKRQDVWDAVAQAHISLGNMRFGYNYDKLLREDPDDANTITPAEAAHVQAQTEEEARS